MMASLYGFPLHMGLSICSMSLLVLWCAQEEHEQHPAQHHSPQVFCVLDPCSLSPKCLQPLGIALSTIQQQSVIDFDRLPAVGLDAPPVLPRCSKALGEMNYRWMTLCAINLIVCL